MAWVRIDDRYADHPKIIGLSDAAFRLHIKAICYANGHLTDGVLPPAFLNGQEALTDELANAGLLELSENGYFKLHDYEDYQPSKEEVLEERRKARERMSRVRKNSERTSEEVSGKLEKSSVYPVPGPGPVPIPKPEKRERGAFAPPTLAEIESYVSEKGYHFSPKAFMAYYSEREWRRNDGKKLRDWHLACVTWEEREFPSKGGHHRSGTAGEPVPSHPPMYTGIPSPPAGTDEDRDRLRREMEEFEAGLPPEERRIVK